jgi:hypothetical protein
MKKLLLLLLMVTVLSNTAHATYLPNHPSLIADYENGAFEDFSTANTWYKNTNWDSATVFKNFSADLPNGEFYYTGPTADFYIQVNASIRAPYAAVFEQGIFKNGTAIDIFPREMTVGPERNVTFVSISSADQNVAYGTYSTLESLYFSDGDRYEVLEDAAASTNCLIAYFEVSNIDVPYSINWYNTNYGGSVNHYGMVEVFSNTSSAWHDVNKLLEDYTYTEVKKDTSYGIPSPRVDYVLEGVVKFRWRHNNTNCAADTLFVDSVKVRDRLNSIPFPSFHKETLSNGDKISVRYRSSLPESEVVFNHVELLILEINK